MIHETWAKAKQRLALVCVDVGFRMPSGKLHNIRNYRKSLDFLFNIDLLPYVFYRISGISGKAQRFICVMSNTAVP